MNWLVTCRLVCGQGTGPKIRDNLSTPALVHGQVHEGLVSKDEAEECIGIEFNPVRAGFAGGEDVWTRDVLNLGVRPDKLIAKVLARHATGTALCHVQNAQDGHPGCAGGCCPV